MKRISYALLLGAISMTSCKSAITAKRHLEPKELLVAKPVVVDLSVGEKKLSAIGKGTSSAEAEQKAYNSFIAGCQCDAVISPQYITVSIGGAYASELKAYPGFYKNFRSVDLTDKEILDNYSK